jgi:crossover junction endodeoxyribonuclease RuvC
MKLIGIDPGKNGGLAFIEAGKLIEHIIMPTYEGKDEKDHVDFVAVGRFMKKHNPEKVYIERVGAMPGQGVVSMFRFGWVTGGLHGVCGALELTVELVGPRQWQKALMGDETHEKEDTIAYVMKEFPGVNLMATKRSKKPHDGMSDAIAIAKYGYDTETSKKL